MRSRSLSVKHFNFLTFLSTKMWQTASFSRSQSATWKVYATLKARLPNALRALTLFKMINKISLSTYCTFGSRKGIPIFLSRYTVDSFEAVCLWSVRAVKWCCHINMSLRDPISSPRPLSDRATLPLLNPLLAGTVWLFTNKQTETKDSQILTCRNSTLWKPQKGGSASSERL